MEFELDAIAVATGGEVVTEGPAVNGVTIDSRELVEGALFVAVVAERDGHDFLAAAAESGAGAALVSDRAKIPDGLAAVVVDDTQAALQLSLIHI